MPGVLYQSLPLLLCHHSNAVFVWAYQRAGPLNFHIVWLPLYWLVRSAPDNAWCQLLANAPLLGGYRTTLNIIHSLKSSKVMSLASILKAIQVFQSSFWVVWLKGSQLIPLLSFLCVSSSYPLQFKLLYGTINSLISFLLPFGFNTHTGTHDDILLNQPAEGSPSSSLTFSLRNRKRSSGRHGSTCCRTQYQSVYGIHPLMSTTTTCTEPVVMTTSIMTQLTEGTQPFSHKICETFY